MIRRIYEKDPRTGAASFSHYMTEGNILATVLAQGGDVNEPDSVDIGEEDSFISWYSALGVGSSALPDAKEACYV